MITVTSISGGKTSAYLAANYPADFNVFALVRTEDKKSLFPDKKLREMVEDRIQKPFIATAEDDKIVKTIFDLEQFMGREIQWVSGITFDELIRSKCGWLPNKLHRFCTSLLKIQPIFEWWHNSFDDPVAMNIGYRANETRRVARMMEKTNSNGFLEMKATFEKHPSGRNKWQQVEWQKPVFPLLPDQVFKDKIEGFWSDKPVEFAPLNNCVFCFHRNPVLLRKMYEEHPEKIQWAADQEGGKKGFFRSDVSYQKIINHRLQIEIDFEDFSECDSGYCGI